MRAWIPTITVLAFVGALAVAMIWIGRGGFQDKTLWDLLDLLIIPAILAIGGFLFNRAERQSDRELAADRARENALQGYLDSMSSLILEHALVESKSGDLVRKVAQARTHTVLRTMDGRRKAILLSFLVDSDLIFKDNVVVSLSGADLSDAELKDRDLAGIFLVNANLMGADLRGAELSGTNLYGADLTGADLAGAFLGEAVLTDAKVTINQLEQAASLDGAYPPDGSDTPIKDKDELKRRSGLQD